ncbi:hypothetical protein KUTeg_003811 [Tegillarca granosa]|uniref:Uncharacterized protein n=1 Tax=Tegillarca granosa TaxID=220873 RepID=A0ABQ9FSM6_TEGGR|nr:hypothetical protein KUTeg_003811 [Tegillarca granosa]
MVSEVVIETMSAIPFDQPRLDWGAGDQYQEFLRFRQHVEFCFKGPLAKAEKKDKAGWIGLWIGLEGREGQEITIEKTIQIGQQFELSQAQVKMMRGEDVMKVGVKQHNYKHVKNDKPVNTPPSSNKADSNAGSNMRHSRYVTIKLHIGKCPAKGTTCNYCKGCDHWARKCKKRQKNRVHIVQASSDVESDSTSDEEMLAIHTTSVVDVNVLDDKWTVNLNINGADVKFRIDTGSRVNILTKTQVDKLPGQINMNKSLKTLKSFSNHKIYPVGSVELPVMYSQDNVCQAMVSFEIVDFEQENIISGDSAMLLGLLIVPSEQPQMLNTYSLFQGSAEDELTRDFPDLRRGVKELSPLAEGTPIRMKTPDTKTLSPGTVINKTDKPRSYIVESNGRLYRRNRKHLHTSTKTANEKQSVPDQEFEDSASFNNIEIPKVENPTLNNQALVTFNQNFEHQVGCVMNILPTSADQCNEDTLPSEPGLVINLTLSIDQCNEDMMPSDLGLFINCRSINFSEEKHFSRFALKHFALYKLHCTLLNISFSQTGKPSVSDQIMHEQL